jgi:hypothetical protein
MWFLEYVGVSWLLGIPHAGNVDQSQTVTGIQAVSLVPFKTILWPLVAEEVIGEIPKKTRGK